MTAILGISALYHDSAAALLIDDQLVAAAEEERFTRRKHDARFPELAIAYCLEQAGIGAEELDYVGFYDKPFLKFDRLLETYLSYAPRGYRSFAKAMPSWLKQKQFVPREIRRALGHTPRHRTVFAEHHESHAASAFFPSPFQEAAILTLDGVGEWATASLGVGRGNRVELTHTLQFPHSLGLLYTAFTSFAGFAVNSDEYKLMGLAPYGEPVYYDAILEELIDLKADGSFRMDMSYFGYCEGLTMTSKRFDVLFGGPPRPPESRITKREMDLAASIQKLTEEIVLRCARHLHASTGLKNLCLAGGVAQNCVANGRLAREGPFEKLWIQPAAGDAGGALGVALLIRHQLLGEPRRCGDRDTQRGSLLGSGYSDDEIGELLRTAEVAYRRVEDDETLVDEVAGAIADGQVVGWFQGRMEFGPRALGSRSILADSRDPRMQATLNRKVKFREGFRPFAPMVLEEHAREYFELEPAADSPYMLLVAPVRAERRLPLPAGDSGAVGIDRLRQPRSQIPAVTHVDGSARIQTVGGDASPRLRRLLERFHEKTGCPVLINTSFNLGWDPIVRTPREALETFLSSEIDVLCMGRFLLTKQSQRATVRAAAPGTEAGLEDGLLSPCCREALRPADGGLACRACGHVFDTSGGIPRLFWPHESFDDPSDVTERVRAFYEQTPFPNYDDHDSARSLIEKSRAGLYARLLDRSIPFNSEVLEVGCGTGQLANFLGIGCRRVVGTDLCVNSLALGEAFRRKCELSRVRFVQMNLFRPTFAPGRFDAILCNGVLHHTSDPRGGFETLVPLLKPGGHFVLGLYSRTGRLLSGARRQVFRLTGGRARWIDPVLRRSGFGEARRRAWFADQYRHPHESRHGIDEVLCWFDAAGLEFVRGIPAVRPDDDGLAGDSLFEPQPRGSALEHRVAEASQIFSAGQREGGLFILIGRRPEAP